MLGSASNPSATTAQVQAVAGESIGPWNQASSGGVVAVKITGGSRRSFPILFGVRGRSNPGAGGRDKLTEAIEKNRGTST